MEVVSGTGVWAHTGRPAVPLRWGRLRAPNGQCAPPAWRGTTLAGTPLPGLAGFVWRWQGAGTCEEARAHLGLETPRQGSANAGARTTPGVLGLSSLLSLWAARVREQQGLTGRRDAWYAKECVTCAATRARVRRWRGAEHHFQMSHTEADLIPGPRALYERLTETLCYAA